MKGFEHTCAGQGGFKTRRYTAMGNHNRWGAVIEGQSSVEATIAVSGRWSS